MYLSLASFHEDLRVWVYSTHIRFFQTHALVFPLLLLVVHRCSKVNYLAPPIATGHCNFPLGRPFSFPLSWS